MKNKQVYEKLIEIPINNDYTTESLLNYLHRQTYWKLISIYFSRQTNRNIVQKINLIRILEENDWATVFFTTEKQQKTILNFPLDS